MRTHEFTSVNEATNDSIDLLTISKYVADYLIDKKPKTPVTLSDMAASHTLPKFRSGVMINLLFDQQLRFTLNKPVKGVVGWYEPDGNYVSVDRRLVNHKQELTSILSHEIQHALDDYKSHGKALKPHGKEDTYKDYLKRPQEINARFAQALVDVVNFELQSIKEVGRVGTAKETMYVIKQCLGKNSLARPLFPEGAEGDRQYNRLVSRAYKFYDESNHLVTSMGTEPSEKSTMISKIKTLIKKYLF